MEIVYRSTDDLERALRDAAAAHGEHERQLGHFDEDWPVWYAAYMARARTATTGRQEP
jgi:hypothetical protein